MPTLTFTVSDSDLSDASSSLIPPTYFNELPITSATDITAQVRALAAGTSTTITVVRDEQVLTFDVTLGSLE